LISILLYQEWLTTRPWDILLAAGVIAVVASVPVAVAIGTWIQKRRAEAARRIPWLRRRARAADEARAHAQVLSVLFDVAFWLAVIVVVVTVDVLRGGMRSRHVTKGAG
jgi:hypothetical protein